MPIDPYNANTNLTNRQIKINMKAMLDETEESYDSNDSNDNSKLMNDVQIKIEYKPSITTINLNKKLRNIGLPIPRSLCSELWCVMDCGGYFGVGFTWLFIFVGEMLVFLTLNLREPSTATFVNALFSAIFAIFGFVAHCRAMFTDPGAVPRGDATDENISKLSQLEGRVFYRCVKCDSIKPDRAHHCSTCKRCIRKMDHHCPWINNCVGEGNQKYFILFTLYICLISWHALALAIYNLITCAFHDISVGPTIGRREFSPAGCNYEPAFVIIITICLMMEGLLFGLFTLIMFCTQFSSVCSDQTGIESLKKEKRQRRTCLHNLQEVFGGPPSLKWLSPFHSYKNIQKTLNFDFIYEVM